MNFSLFNKLTFIANMAFLSAMVMRYYPVLQGTTAESLLLISGLVLSPIANLALILHRIYAYFTGSGWPKSNGIFWINLGIAILQVLLLLFFSGTFSFNSFAHDSSYH